MDTKYTAITIETLILVAAWKTPSVFQGCFKITKKKDDSTQYLLFRCESDIEQNTMAKEDFSPNQYEFTHLYNDSNSRKIINLGAEVQNALYLLKYALHLTLNAMRVKNQAIKYIDEVAMTLITETIKPILQDCSWTEKAEHVGFAVAVDFNPSEEIGEAAVLSLLKLKCTGQKN